MITLNKDVKVISNEDVDSLKRNIKKLYDSGKMIHIIVKPKKKHPITAESKITGIYERFFSVTSHVGFYEESFTITYISVLTKEILINELNS